LVTLVDPFASDEKFFSIAYSTLPMNEEVSCLLSFKAVDKKNQRILLSIKAPIML
jgi:ribosomal protein S1